MCEVILRQIIYPWSGLKFSKITVTVPSGQLLYSPPSTVLPPFVAVPNTACSNYTTIISGFQYGFFPG